MARLAFLIGDMGGGGAERVTASLVNGAVRRGHQVDLVLMRAVGSNLERIDPAVNVIELGADRVRNVLRPLISYLRDAHPDSLHVSMWPLTIAAIFAARLVGGSMRLVTTDHVTLSRQYGHLPARMAALRASIRLLYPKAHQRVAVSQGSADELAQISGAPVNAIYNPIAPIGEGPVGDEVLATWAGARRRILCVGNLKKQKNHALLIEALALVDPNHDFGLVILGEGELRERLMAQAEALGVAGRVAMPGYVPDPSAYYRAAELFVLSSDYEGFGNVVVEALSAGLRIVSTDCRDGPAEILDGGAYGMLVSCGDAKALATAITESLAAPVDPARQRRRATDFAEDIAVERYLELML